MHSLRRYYPDQVQGFEDVSASLVSARAPEHPYHATLQLFDAIYSITILSNPQAPASLWLRRKHLPEESQGFQRKLPLIRAAAGV